MLAAIGCITGDEGVYKIAENFLEKWLKYTETRGYGWGENLSLGYNSVILRAFNIIFKAIHSEEIKSRFKRLENGILDIFRFHNGYEFVPTIRSYNVLGNPKPWTLVYNLAGVRGYGFLDGNQESFGSGKNDANYRLIADYMIYGDRIYMNDDDYLKRELSNNQNVPRIGEFKIMDDKKSYTWLGRNGGIGSINEFPIIEGSYQHKTWGLGWQCFPASIIVYDNQVSFLRFYVDEGERIRCHPHKDKHSAFLDPSLFSESYYPEVKTACRQNGQTLVVFRSINNLRNKVSHIMDSYDVPGFTGECKTFFAKERKWIALFYDKAVIFASALLGNPAAGEKTFIDEKGNKNPTTLLEIDLVEDDDGLRLVQTMYSGELKTLYNNRLSAGWLFHYIDRYMTNEEAENFIKELSVDETCIPDGEIPRMPEWNVHVVSVYNKGEKILDVRYDPYK